MKTPAREAAPAARRVARRRPYAIVGGLVLSFSVVTLFGSWLLSALHLPQDLLRNLGLVVLAAVGLGLLVPPVGDVLERPFARLARGRQRSDAGGFVLGLSLGLLFVPCAGPVLAAIVVVGSSHRIGLSAVVLTVAFAVGAAVPLLAFAIAGERTGARVAAVRHRAPLVRRIVGVVMIVTSLAIWLNWTDGLQTALPGYTDTLQNHVAGGAAATRALDGVKGVAPGAGSGGSSAVPTGSTGTLADCDPGNPSLQLCGAAPAFTGITAWLNTPSDRPLTIAGLRGKVVLVDFWTYSCINCQRTLPHVEAWYRAYHDDGLVVVGVHSPEFSFEHVVGNVEAADAQLGVDYPVAVDDDLDTWNAYSNNYWPAEYLIDASGTVRHVDFGEGDYGQSESFIRQLLVAAHPGLSLPPATGVPDRTPTEETTPETYLGYQEARGPTGEQVDQDTMARYSAPSTLPPDGYAFDGSWQDGSQSATAGPAASLRLEFSADDVYLVLGGTGAVGVDVAGHHVRTVTVGGIPRLYTLVSGSSPQSGLLTLTVSPGVSAYDFTFG